MLRHGTQDRPGARITSRASSKCQSSSNWAMASDSLRLPGAYSPSVSGRAVPWSNDSCSQIAFSTIRLSSRGA